jgi:hypothetical protein
MADRDPIYPGEGASAQELHKLAEVYRDAAYRAAGSIKRGDPMTAAPLRLLALHSVELNLSAYLILTGSPAVAVRRLGHDLGARLALAVQAGLVLRRRTAAHVEAVARDREYLVARYGPERLGTASQVNRLLATMDEIGGKVSRAFLGGVTCTTPAGDVASCGRVAGRQLQADLDRFNARSPA